MSIDAEGFVHLRVRSAYSLLEGAIKADAIGRLAAAAGMPAVALTDRANLFGALEFSVVTKDAGVQPIVGCALPVTGIGEGRPERWARTPTIVLLAQNETGYRNLCELSSAAFLEVEADRRAACALGQGRRARRGPDPAVRRAGRAGRSAVRRRPERRRAARRWPRCSACSATASTSSCSATAWRAEAAAEPGLVAWAYENDVPLVATNDVYFAKAETCTGARRPAVHRRRRLRRPGGAAAGHRRALVQAGARRCARCSPTCRRPATTPSRSPAAAPSWSRSAIRSCRASPPWAGRSEDEELADQAREGLTRAPGRRAAGRTARTPTGRGWSARSASSSRWASPATS